MTNTLLLHNFTYFYVAKEDLKVYNLVNPPTGGQTGVHSLTFAVQFVYGGISDKSKEKVFVYRL